MLCSARLPRSTSGRCDLTAAAWGIWVAISVALLRPRLIHFHLIPTSSVKFYRSLVFEEFLLGCGLSTVDGSVSSQHTDVRPSLVFADFVLGCNP